MKIFLDQNNTVVYTYDDTVVVSDNGTDTTIVNGDLEVMLKGTFTIVEDVELPADYEDGKFLYVDGAFVAA